MTEATSSLRNSLPTLFFAKEPEHLDPVPTVSALFSASPLAVALFEGASLRHRWANGKWAQHLSPQLTAGELEGTPLPSLLHEGETPLLAVIRRAQQTNEPQKFEKLQVRGFRGELSLHGVALPWHGRVLLQLQEQPRRENRRLHGTIGSFAEQVLEQIPHPVVVLSRTGRVLRANNRARTRFGVQQGQRGADVLKTLELRDESERLVRENAVPVLRTLRGETVEMRGSVRDRLFGERRECILYGGPLLQQGKVAASLVSCIDITELRRLERAKDEFLNIAAHELKTPLTAVRAYLQLSQRKGLADPSAEGLIQGALAGTYRMQRLIADMLDSARLDTGRLRLQIERVDICKLILDLEERQRRNLEDQRTIDVDVEGSMFVEGDFVRLEQIVGSLLSNAIRHGPPGQPVQIRASRDGGCVLIEIEDRGIGVKKDQAEKIFERLFRGDTAPGDGLGLGLFLARQLAELHGGSVGVDPDKQGGARFFVRLPLAD